MPSSVASHTPVLVGIGTASRREENFEHALEPMDLMLEAVATAGADSGSPAALAGAQYVAVPRGRWKYGNPAGAIARAIGAEQATTVLATVGVLQQTLIGEACARIACGEAHTALVAGADAGYRLLRAQIAGREAVDLNAGLELSAAGQRLHGDAPDITLAPKDELRHPAEKRAGMRMPVGLYAIMESAFRAKNGWSVTQHRDRLADLGRRFSRVAADNPHAWQRKAVDSSAIREATERNPMQAFPYTRFHCSTWNVDQAAAPTCPHARVRESPGGPRSRPAASVPMTSIWWTFTAVFRLPSRPMPTRSACPSRAT